MDLDLVAILVPLVGVLLGAVVVVAASLWARGVESALSEASGTTSGMPGGEAPAMAPGSGVNRANGWSVKPATLLQPPEDAPPA
jgi:hypothetical protein